MHSTFSILFSFASLNSGSTNHLKIQILYFKDQRKGICKSGTLARLYTFSSWKTFDITLLSMAVRLFIKQKQLHITEYRGRQSEGQICTQSQLASWAHQTMKLPERSSKALISKTLKNSLHVTNSYGNVLAKSMKSSHYPQIEQALMT